jgi:hypothetical protein
MKRYTHTLKYKAYVERKARRSLARQWRFKGWQRFERRREERIPKRLLQERNSHKHTRFGFTAVWAPEHFSFVDNPEGVSHFIALLERFFIQRRPVFVVLSEVTHLDDGAVVVLLSVMVRFKADSIRFNGDLPHNEAARKVLLASRFLDYLYKRFRDDDSYEFAGNRSIFTHAKRTVDSELGEKVIAASSQTVWGEPRRCPGVQRALIELMHNTNNHASPLAEGEKHWWLSVKHVKQDHRVSFSFVDYGIGVFRSLEQKAPGTKFFGAITKLAKNLLDDLVHGSNAEILRLIFQGVLHKTATGQSYRGKGLPGIYRAFRNGTFSDFVMITNDAMYDSRTEKYTTLSRPFSGTFVYWTLTPENRSLSNVDKD